jgi:hypothetical protein
METHPIPAVLMARLPQPAYALMRATSRPFLEAGATRDVVLRARLEDVPRARAVFRAATRLVVSCDDATESLASLDGLHDVTLVLSRRLACLPRVACVRVVCAPHVLGTLEAADGTRALHLPRGYDASALVVPSTLRSLAIPAARNVHLARLAVLTSLDVTDVRPLPTLELPSLTVLVARGVYMPHGSLRFLSSLTTLDARDALRLDLCTAAGLALDVDARGAALPWEDRHSLASSRARFDLEGAFWRVGPVVRYALESAPLSAPRYSRR